MKELRNERMKKLRQDRCSDKRMLRLKDFKIKSLFYWVLKTNAFKKIKGFKDLRTLGLDRDSVAIKN